MANSQSTLFNLVSVAATIFSSKCNARVSHCPTSIIKTVGLCCSQVLLWQTYYHATTMVSRDDILEDFSTDEEMVGQEEEDHNNLWEVEDVLDFSWGRRTTESSS